MHELDPALDLRNVGVAARLARSTYKSSIRVNTAVATVRTGEQNHAHAAAWQR